MPAYLVPILIGIILGAGIIYLCLRKKLKVTQTINDEIALKNQELQKEQTTLNLAISQLTSQKQELKNSVKDLQDYADEYYQKNLELATERLNTSLERAAEKYQQDEQEYQDEYLKTIKESAEAFANEVMDKKLEIDQLTDTLNTLRASVHAAVEAHKRDLEDKNKVEFYRLQVPESDVKEIKVLREVIPKLRDPEALNKVVWKVYYEKPYTDLIGRVVGNKTKTGIYKLTNIENGMCYVGQAVDIADRWKTHIKRGCGAESGGRNKLYPAMYAIGPENFTFEIIEECDRSKLNEREDYWQEYFKAKEFGYSIK